MANFSLRRYDVQAKVSLWVAIASIVSLFGLAYSVLLHANFSSLQDFEIPYSRAERRLLVFGAGAMTLMLAASGFLLGLNSAGQRRNDKQMFSWLGFFISAGVLCVAAALVLLFLIRGQFVG